MKLTHHSTPSRSFVLLTIVVLLTAYAALVLTRINRLYTEVTTDQPTEQPIVQPPTNQPTIADIPSLNSDDWVEYSDDKYPFTILVPKGWRIRINDQMADFYLVSITQSKPQSLVSLFVGREQPEKIAFLPSKTMKTRQGYTVTNYDNKIYQLKVGEFYYSFDGSEAPEAQDVLWEIVNSAKLE